MNGGLCGGKGGFGAQLKAQGARAANIPQDDCRDLNGRRIRQIKDETRLTEWEKEERLRLQDEEKKKKKKQKVEESQRVHQVSESLSKDLIDVKNTVQSALSTGLSSKKKKIKIEKQELPEEEEELMFGLDLLEPEEDLSKSVEDQVDDEEKKKTKPTTEKKEKTPKKKTTKKKKN